MANSAVLILLFVLQKGQAALVQTQHTVMAAVGEDACLSCQLIQPKDVLQVTWWKLSPEGEKNVATSTKYFGLRVDPGFIDKVEFKDAGLQNSSIVIMNVMEQDEGCYRCLFNSYPEGALTGTTCLKVYGQTALILTQHTVLAAVGEESCLNCQLIQPKEVLHVTWWKILAKGEMALGSCHKSGGESVNPDFTDKIKFEYAGLQNCSIIIRNVTEQDESCYRCLFNINHEVDLNAVTCLELYELHEPVLHVESNSAEEAVVSCSATGRPAPTVTLRVLQQDLHLSNYSSVSVTNTNSTVTVTSTAVLSGFHDDSTQVGCAVRVLSGPQKEVFMMIPEVKQSSADGFAEKSGSNNRDRSWAVISVSLVVVVCGIVAALVFFRRKQENKNRNSDKNQTDKRTEDTHEVQTPLVDQEEIRQLTAESDKSTADTHENSEENQTDKPTEDTHEVKTPLVEQEKIRQLTPEETNQLNPSLTKRRLCFDRRNSFSDADLRLQSQYEDSKT